MTISSWIFVFQWGIPGDQVHSLPLLLALLLELTLKETSFLDGGDIEALIIESRPIVFLAEQNVQTVVDVNCVVK